MKILAHHFHLLMMGGLGEKLNCSFINPSAVTWLFLSQSQLLSLQQMGCPSTTFFVLFPFFRGQLLFPRYLFLQSCFLQSCLSSFSISTCSAALLDVQCSMACSCLYPMVVHRAPRRGNGHQDPASNLKESNQHAAFYQPAGEPAVSSQDSRNEEQEV